MTNRAGAAVLAYSSRPRGIGLKFSSHHPGSPKDKRESECEAQAKLSV